jgi:hypothetical protein
MADLANDIVPVLWDLQAAHERLVNHNANRMLIRIVKGLREKVITFEQAQQLFELDETALAELLKRLDIKPQKDLVDHLSNLKGLKTSGRSRRKTSSIG